MTDSTDAQIESLPASAAEADSARRAAETHAAQLKAAMDHGLPTGLASRLSGGTGEELDADAAALAQTMSSMRITTPRPDPSMGVRSTSYPLNPAAEFGNVLHRALYGKARY